MWRRIDRVRKQSTRSTMYSAFCQRHLMLFVGVCLLSVLAGCALPGQRDMSHSSHPAATAQPTATPPPGPVVVTLISEQHGTLAAQNVKLTVAVTVTNHATQPIGIAAEGMYCHFPPFSFYLLDRAGHQVSQPNNGGSCPPPLANDVRDLTTIGAGQAQSWQVIFDLTVEYGLQPGPYTIEVQNIIWHEGPISNTGVMRGLHGVASGQLPIIVY